MCHGIVLVLWFLFSPHLPTSEGYEEKWVEKEGKTKSGRERGRGRGAERE